MSKENITRHINGAVAIKISIDRKKKIAFSNMSFDSKKKLTSLQADLARLINGMSTEEYNEYLKRIV